MIPTFRVYFHTQWSMLLAYRFAVFIWVLWAIFPPLIFLGVWATIAGTGTAGGWSRGEFVGYYLTFMVVNHLAASIELHSLGHEIRQGRLSGRLLLPVHPGISTLAENVGYKALGMAVLVPTVVLLALIFRPELNTEPWMVVLGILAIVPAAIIQFLLGYSIALLSFWLTRADAIWWMHYNFISLLSGELAPVALLPAPLHTVSLVAPYRYMLSFPVELITGRLHGAAVLAGFAAQGFWLAASWGIARFTWRQGLRHYTAVGS